MWQVFKTDLGRTQAFFTRMLLWLTSHWYPSAFLKPTFPTLSSVYPTCGWTQPEGKASHLETQGKLWMKEPQESGASSPALTEPGSAGSCSTDPHRASEARCRYSHLPGCILQKTKHSFSPGSSARTFQKGKNKTIAYPCKSKFIEQWQAANRTISGLLSHLLGLLTAGKYKQITSSATNSQ